MKRTTAGILTGLLVAVCCAVPARITPSDSIDDAARSLAVPGFVAGEIGGMILYFVVILGVYAYGPAFLGGFTTSVIDGAAGRLGAVVVGLLCIPAFLILDYIVHGFISLAGVPVLIVLALVTPFVALLGAIIQRLTFQIIRKNNVEIAPLRKPSD